MPETDLKNSSLPVPQHIAIIMDGNGRWAKQRGLPVQQVMQREAKHSAVLPITAERSV